MEAGSGVGIVSEICSTDGIEDTVEGTSVIGTNTSLLGEMDSIGVYLAAP